MDNATAKKIFLQYGGNKSMMHTDSVLEEYLSYKVDPNVEAQWNMEILNELLIKINESEIVDFEFNRFLKKAIEMKCFSKISEVEYFFLEKLDLMDDYSKFLLVKNSINFLLADKNHKNNNEHKIFINHVYLKINKENPTIKPDYKKKGIIKSSYQTHDFLCDLNKISEKVKKL